MKRKLLGAVLALSLCVTSLITVPDVAMASSQGTVIKGFANQESPGTWTDSADINVTGMTQGEPGNHIVYSIKVKWGAMKFVYDYGGRWDPVTHTYGVGAQSGEVDPGWVQSYVTGNGVKDSDGIYVYNNSVTVINDSNYPVTAKLTYKMTNGVFNASSTEPDAVDGTFGDDRDTLWENYCSKPAGSRSPQMKSVTFNLDSKDPSKLFYADMGSVPTAKEATTFLALYGTPTKSKVNGTCGTINVAIKPYESPSTPTP